MRRKFTLLILFSNLSPSVQQEVLNCWWGNPSSVVLFSEGAQMMMIICFVVVGFFPINNIRKQSIFSTDKG